MAFNVLIVDDSSSMRAIIKKIVKISGFNVGQCWEAADGKDAMKVLLAEWVDLVLTDISMPNMNGLELLSTMKKDEILKSIPVVMISTEGSDKAVRESEELGASGYIKKPFVPEDIKRTLSAIMGEAEDGQRENDESFEGCDF
ncbi:MAG: response regulator [Deltaproteobacteria bacterium]|nr:response regulator [Deltaproteobacteria bacterium]MBW1934013.1 response regulator [Deltaproteobacteria bacterium]MBW1976414.1 response regulator [Deltaproteobacteria bacterium]MBW2043308.1 response regulator [Deltaproteobacteria bacterium]MBW2299400.1 response regulator [Deltaproteobacteria bacterium]